MGQLVFSPSLMCGDLLNLESVLRVLRTHKFDYVHLDIMDGHFVPNITFGFDLINGVRGIPRDIHLMVEHPELSVSSLHLSPDDLVTIHIESKDDIMSMVRLIHSFGSQAGLAISPTTPIKALRPFLDYIDHILIMTVNPGFAGRPFVETSYKRAQELVDMIGVAFSDISIGVDGAIGFKEIEMFSELGVTHFVLGTTALFKGDLNERAAVITDFKLKLGQLQL